MIETIDNALQLFVTGLCTMTAAYGAARYHRKEWTLAALFSGVFFMGILYWFLYIIFYSHSPVYSGIPYVSWWASYIFLSLLLVEVKGKEGKLGLRRFWPVFLFTGAMCLYYMQYGAYVNNSITAVLMGILICGSLEGVLKQPARSGGRLVCIFTLGFCLLEYCLWTASCVWDGVTLTGPYFWCDLLLTADFLLIIFAVRKAVADELH